MSYISDEVKVQQVMGQFDVWCDKLFYYSGERLGWRFLRDLHKELA